MTYLSFFVDNYQLFATNQELLKLNPDDTNSLLEAYLPLKSLVDQDTEYYRAKTRAYSIPIKCFDEFPKAFLKSDESFDIPQIIFKKLYQLHIVDYKSDLFIKLDRLFYLLGENFNNSESYYDLLRYYSHKYAVGVIIGIKPNYKTLSEAIAFYCGLVNSSYFRTPFFNDFILNMRPALIIKGHYKTFKSNRNTLILLAHLRFNSLHFYADELQDIIQKPQIFLDFHISLINKHESNFETLIHFPGLTYKEKLTLAAESISPIFSLLLSSKSKNHGWGQINGYGEGILGANSPRKLKDMFNININIKPVFYCSPIIWYLDRKNSIRLNRIDMKF